MPFPIYFGGFFDNVQLGAPVYFWIIFILGMMLVCVIILALYYRYLILDKVWAFVECYKKRTPLALIRTRYRKAYMKSLQYVAQTFIDEDTGDMWSAPSLETSSNMEGVNLIEAVDYYDWLQDPILNQAIHELVFEWNTKHPDDKIGNSMDFQKKLSEGALNDLFEGQIREVHIAKGQVPVQAFFFVDIAKIEQYLPKNRSSVILAGVAQKLGDGIGNKDAANMKMAGYYLAGGAILIIICAIIAYLILHS
ncbi:MAG: hypothetical protein PHC39_04585 [Proteiniphilum sp.]|nr:hypothetical protein [Proteiniphilum sp.]